MLEDVEGKKCESLSWECLEAYRDGVAAKYTKVLVETTFALKPVWALCYHDLENNTRP
jgi:hypothetical protein